MRKTLLLSLLFVLFTVFAYAQDTNAENTKSDELGKKIELLEARIAELEKSKAESAKVSETKAKSSEAVGLAKYVSLYGYLKLDYAFDTSRTAGGASWALWVLPNYDGTVGTGVNARTFKNNNDYESNMSARNTRLGLHFKPIGLNLIKAQMKGRFEFDFNGGNRAVDTWKALPRLRIAALTVDWGWVEIMAGNHWDTFSARVFPQGDPNVAHAYSGSVGFRRPQIRLSFKPMLGKKTRLWVQAAIARPFDIANADYDNMGQVAVEKDLNGDGNITAKDEYGRVTGESVKPKVGDGNNDGEDSMVPMVQWRVAVETPIWTKKPFILGTGGHYQKASFNSPVGTQNNDSLNSWHTDVELQFPIIEQLMLKGEFFYGQMLKDITGGINQDINPETGEALKSMGGWVNLVGQPFSFWSTSIGYSIEKMDEDTMKVTTAAALEAFRYSNSTIFFNNTFSLGKGFVLELVYVHMMTDYKLSKDGTTATASFTKSYVARNNRILCNMMYKF